MFSIVILFSFHKGVFAFHSWSGVQRADTPQITVLLSKCGYFYYPWEEGSF